jgi:hypothetical protein
MKTIRLGVAALLLATCLLATTPNAANAATVSYIFSGTVNNVEGLGSTFANGDPFTGSFSYETTAPRRNDLSGFEYATFFEGLTSFYFTVGTTYSASQTGGGGFIHLLNEPPPPSGQGDFFLARPHSFFGLVGEPVQRDESPGGPVPTPRPFWAYV